MAPVIRETRARSVLSRCGIEGVDYTVNPYTGCAHSCRYCYATFMKKYTGHQEPWGGFVDVKTNAAELLRVQLKRARRGTVIMSSVTDPYQPAEGHYRITRGCLEVLAEHQFSLEILTKSPLVLRDMDLLSRFSDLDVGLTVSTDDERMRRLFEPGAPPIKERIRALAQLRAAGIHTYAFIGPLLPSDPERLAAMIKPHVERVLIDKMNYEGKTRGIYAREGLDRWLDASFVASRLERLKATLGDKHVLLC